jgi:alpha-L-rhamnosidase
LDLGRTVHGRLTAEVEGQPGAILDIGWDERLTQDTQRPLPFPGSLYSPWNQVDSWILDGRARALTTIDARAGRYLLIAAWGNDPIRLKNIQIHEEHYPVVQVGSFHTSDALLNQIWQVGVETLLPNMLDSYVDTPWRERGQWWGDAYVANRINQVAFGDRQLVLRGLEYMANTMQTEPAPGLSPSNLGHHMLDYTMLWVHSLAEMIQILPDDQAYALAANHYTILTRFMGHLESYENPASNLLELPDRHWSQNAYIDTFGRHSRIGQPTALNALYYGTLQQAALIADRVNDPLSATKWQEKAQQVKQNINAALFIPSEHRYLSNLYNGEPTGPSPHAQAWPLVYQIVPDEEIPRVADALLELVSTDPASPNINVFGMNWVLEALGKSGKIAEGIEVINQYYGYMLEKDATTWWELFSVYPNMSQSLSHSWGGAPTRFLTTYVLGISRTGPNTWQLYPGFNSVDSAQGTLPLQDGTLHVQWEKRACDEIIVNISSEKTSIGRLVVPYKPSLIIRHNRSLVWHADTSLSDIAVREGPNILIILSGRRHEITISRDCASP